MKLTKTVRMFGIVATLLGITATQSLALPANELEVVFFSDAKYTNEVGSVFRACNGGVYREGKTSRYRITSSTPCQGGSSLSEVHCNVYLNGFWRETTCPANICDSGLFECK
jgi:hypothetical protein